MRTGAQLAIGLLLVGACLCAGCATRQTPMVCFSPEHPYSSSSPRQLLNDINRSMPFRIEPGDFVVNASIEGLNCWVCFNDTAKTRVLLAVLDRDPRWRFRSLGFVDPLARPAFGLAHNPEIAEAQR